MHDQPDKQAKSLKQSSQEMAETKSSSHTQRYDQDWINIFCGAFQDKSFSRSEPPRVYDEGDIRSLQKKCHEERSANFLVEFKKFAAGLETSGEGLRQLIAIVTCVSCATQEGRKSIKNAAEARLAVAFYCSCLPALIMKILESLHRLDPTNKIDLNSNNKKIKKASEVRQALLIEFKRICQASFSLHEILLTLNSQIIDRNGGIQTGTSILQATGKHRLIPKGLTTTSKSVVMAACEARSLHTKRNSNTEQVALTAFIQSHHHENRARTSLIAPDE